jgi:GDP-mannose 4,6-dehydratase
MDIYKLILKCRICGGSNLDDVINIGEQAITSRFPKYGDFNTPKTPIDLCLCRDCGLLQLKQSTISTELYEYEYGYRSGISNTMKNHLKEYQEEILSKVVLVKGDIILDIGSNDSTMLQYYSKNYKRIGMDPTGKQFKKYYGDIELIEDYFNQNNFVSVYGDSKCKIISSISMFYDLPDPVQFAKDIYEILEDDGIWTCEQSYVISMLKQNSFDTICHEHLEYYGLHQIKQIADMANLKIIDVSFNDCNGGSFRLYFCKKDSEIYGENIEKINKILREEVEYGLFDIKTYEKFMKKCQKEMDKLCDLIDTINNNGKQIWIYGASTKGNCLLQYANIDEKRIRYAVERNPDKIGKMTVTGIEIISEEQMRNNPPEYLLVLPWHFRNEIIERENTFLENGGKLVFPLPEIEIYSKKEKVLITGCDGHIASYLLDIFSPEKYCLFGIRRKKNVVDQENGIRDDDPETNDNRILKISFDLCNKKLLESSISIIKPSAIVHLAGITNSVKAFENPETSIITNGLITVNLCEIIHSNNYNIKLFNASSSTIYKGHEQYTIKEDDNNFFHNHPYSIGKILGHTTVDFYRNTYNLPFSNGIIFSAESPRKNKENILNKVAYHAKNWKNKKDTLILGSLASYRNMIHAIDVARAIEIIINQDYGNNYLICNETSLKILDLVIKIYKSHEIELITINNNLFDKETGEMVIEIKDNKNGLDNTIIDIKGYPTKLKALNWFPLHLFSDRFYKI